MLNASQRRVNKNSLTWWYVLKISLKDVLKTNSKRLEKVLEMSWRQFSRRLEDVLKTLSKHLEDILKTYGQDEYIGLDQNVLKMKMSSEDARVKRTYLSWSRRLEDVLKKSSEDEDERRLQDIFIKTNVCWNLEVFNTHEMFFKSVVPEHKHLQCYIFN